MTIFDGRVEELENILIDNFVQYKSYTCFFLSHCHSDHMNGLSELFSNKNDFNYHIYCSPISRLILRNKFNLVDENITRELTSTEVITVPGNDFAPSYQVTVTPIPAGHCPGSIMFLLETVTKVVLYTGDFRIAHDDITKFKPFHFRNQVKILDKLYFDSTFFNENYWNFPLRSEVINELLNIIENWLSKSLSNNVMLETSALYGYESVFTEIARKLKCKIHVKDKFYELFWNVPEVGVYLTKNCSSTRVHVSGMFDKKCFPYSSDELLIVRLSAQWYKSKKDGSIPPIKKEISCRKVLLCYSTHSSCSELVYFLNYFKPKGVRPFVTAVGSTEEDMNAYIEQLAFSWEIQKRVESTETPKTSLKLERNFKFNLKIPLCGDNDFEVTPEKKKKQLDMR